MYSLNCCVCVHVYIVVSDSLQHHGLVACQAPLSMEFSRQEYCNGLPFPTPGYLSGPEIKLRSLVFPALAGGFFTTAPPGKQG